MTDRFQKQEIAQKLAAHMHSDEQTATLWLDATIETLYEAFKEGKSVTLPGLGGFYLRPGHTTSVFKFNPAQRLRALFGWSSTYKGKP